MSPLFDWLRRPPVSDAPDAPDPEAPDLEAPDGPQPDAREAPGPDLDEVVERAPERAAIEPGVAPETPLIAPPVDPSPVEVPPVAVPPVDPSPVDTSPTTSTAAASPGDLDAGLARTRGGLMTRLRGLFVADDGAAAWDDIEETLVAGDIGAEVALGVVSRARQRRDATDAEAAVRAELAALLVPRDPAWGFGSGAPGQPAVVLVVGVNGTGKTTTIGKLAAHQVAAGRSVLLAAADTFRAAAIDQLRAWAERSSIAMVAHAPGADPGAVVYDALDAAVARGIDMVIADTAGRLHTKANLMDELTKIRRIVDKRLPGAKPEVLFVLDATTGQNGLAQARAFDEAVGLTGIVLTKLDSTARGGIVFAIEATLGIPVRYVGVGEQAGDLLPFDPDAFVAALFA